MPYILSYSQIIGEYNLMMYFTGGHTRMTTDSCSGPSSVQRVQSASSVPGRKEDDFASILDDEEA